MPAPSRGAAWVTRVSNVIRSRRPKWSTYASKYAAMWVWCGKSGYAAGIGSAAYAIRSREVLMCSDR